MTFSEEAAELHRLEAVALSLGLAERVFEDILLAVVAEAYAIGRPPAQQLTEVRQRIHEAADGVATAKLRQRAELGST